MFMPGHVGCCGSEGAGELPYQTHHRHLIFSLSSQAYDSVPLGLETECSKYTPLCEVNLILGSSLHIMAHLAKEKKLFTLQRENVAFMLIYGFWSNECTQCWARRDKPSRWVDNNPAFIKSVSI